MRLLSLLAALALSCATAGARSAVPPSSSAAASAAAPLPAALAPEALGPWPAPDTAEGKADLAIVLWIQRTRTPEDVARAKYHAKVELDRFAPALPAGVDAATLAATRALVDRAQKWARGPSNAAKDRYRRARPYDADPRVKPAFELEPSFSYPSGHATRGIVTARILAELVPARREALRAIGLQIGYDRVVAGVHYPADVLAGARLGDAVADALLADPDFRRQLEETRRTEWPAKP